jgi:hypothetical protein
MNLADHKSFEKSSLDWECKFNLLVRRLYRLRWRTWLLLVVLGALFYAWKGDTSHFVMVHADHEISGSSAYPVAVSPELVGTYSSATKPGAGYFYDDVLEYRVWLHPDHGAEKFNGEFDYYETFAQYEKAEAFSEATHGAEEPLVLIRQVEWINEPKPGVYVPEKGERITEWQVPWLAGSKRVDESIEDFMKHPRQERH